MKYVLLSFVSSTALVAVVGAAYMFRYSPVQGDALGTVTVFDRWERKVCVFALADHLNKPNCSVNELQR